MTPSMYYQDPDGNRVELQVDLFPDAAATTTWLEQSDFASNPLGVKYGPEEFLAMAERAEDRTEFLKRCVIDPSELLDQLPEGDI